MRVGRTVRLPLEMHIAPFATPLRVHKTDRVDILPDRLGFPSGESGCEKRTSRSDVDEGRGPGLYSMEEVAGFGGDGQRGFGGPGGRATECRKHIHPPMNTWQRRSGRCDG